MTHSGTLPISFSGYSKGIEILVTAPLDGPLEAMLGTATAMQPLFGHQSFPTQLTIVISQSFSETKTIAWHHIHLSRPDRDYIHVIVALCDVDCSSSTLYYHQITNI